MKLFLTLNLIFCLSAAAQDFSPESVRKILTPYMKLLDVDKEALKKERDKIDLGRVLYYDKRLSFNSKISCNSCHDLKNYGSKGEFYLKQIEEKKTFRDVPSNYNLKNFTLFNWIGNDKTLEDKIANAIKSEHEMNMADTEALLKKLAAVEGYKPLFKKAFPKDKEPLNFNNIVTALTEFHKGLVTPAPIDKFLKGDNKALTEKQLQGAYYFDDKSCFACHTGSSFGGQMVIKLGIIEPWPNQKDQGYYSITKDPKHKMTFRVSPLRNIEKTAPYFHDGSSKRMWDAIRKMGRYELGKYISVEEILLIQEFFKSMTGELPLEYIKEPEIP